MPFDIETRLLQGVWGTDGIIAMLFLRLMGSLFVLPWNLRCDSLLRVVLRSANGITACPLSCTLQKAKFSRMTI